MCARQAAVVEPLFPVVTVAEPLLAAALPPAAVTPITTAESAATRANRSASICLFLPFAGILRPLEREDICAPISEWSGQRSRSSSHGTTSTAVSDLSRSHSHRRRVASLGGRAALNGPPQLNGEPEPGLSAPGDRRACANVWA